MTLSNIGAGTLQSSGFKLPFQSVPQINCEQPKVPWDFIPVECY